MEGAGGRRSRGGRLEGEQQAGVERTYCLLSASWMAAALPCQLAAPEGAAARLPRHHHKPPRHHPSHRPPPSSPPPAPSSRRPPSSSLVTRESRKMRDVMGAPSATASLNWSRRFCGSATPLFSTMMRSKGVPERSARASRFSKDAKSSSEMEQPGGDQRGDGGGGVGVGAGGTVGGWLAVQASVCGGVGHSFGGRYFQSAAPRSSVSSEAEGSWL